MALNDSVCSQESTLSHAIEDELGGRVRHSPAGLARDDERRSQPSMLREALLQGGAAATPSHAAREHTASHAHAGAENGSTGTPGWIGAARTPIASAPHSLTVATTHSSMSNGIAAARGNVKSLSSSHSLTHTRAPGTPWMATYRLSPGLLMMYDSLLPVERTPTPLELEHWYVSLAGLSNASLAHTHEDAAGADALALVRRMAENNELAKKRCRAEKMMADKMLAALVAAQESGEGPTARTSTHAHVHKQPVPSAVAKTVLAPILPVSAPESDPVSSVADSSFLAAVQQIALERPQDLHRVVARFLMTTLRLMPHQPWRPTPTADGTLPPPSPDIVAAGLTPSRQDASEATLASPLSTAATRVGASATSAIPPHPDADMPVLDRVREITRVAGNHTTGAKASVLRLIFRGLHSRVRSRSNSLDHGDDGVPAGTTAADRNGGDTSSSTDAGNHGAVASSHQSKARHAGWRPGQAVRSTMGPRLGNPDRRARADGSAAGARAAQPVRTQFSIRGLPSQVMPIPKEMLAGGSSTRGLTSAPQTNSVYRGRAYMAPSSLPAGGKAATARSRPQPELSRSLTDSAVASIASQVVALADSAGDGMLQAPARHSATAAVPVPDADVRMSEMVTAADGDGGGSSVSDLTPSWVAAELAGSASVTDLPSGESAPKWGDSVEARGMEAAASREHRGSIDSIRSASRSLKEDEAASQSSSTMLGRSMEVAPGAIPDASALFVRRQLERTLSGASLTSGVSASTAGVALWQDASAHPRHASSGASVASYGLHSIASSRLPAPTSVRAHADTKPVSRQRLDAALSDFRTFTIMFARGLLSKYPALNALPTLRTSQPTVLSPALVDSRVRSRAGSSVSAQLHFRQVSAEITIIPSKTPSDGDAPVTDALDCAKLVLRTFQEAFHVLVHDVIMPLFQDDCHESDEEWLVAVDTLRALPPCAFGLGHVFCHPSDPCQGGRPGAPGATSSVARALAVYQDAIVCLRMLPLQTSPMSKASAVRTALRCVAIGALIEQDLAVLQTSHSSSQQRALEHDRSSSPAASPSAASAVPTSPYTTRGATDMNSAASAAPSAVGADDLLPRLIFVTLHAAVPRIFSELGYMEECLPQERTAGEEGYAVTSLRGSVMHLQRMFRDRLAAHEHATARHDVVEADEEPRVFDDDEDDGSVTSM